MKFAHGMSEQHFYSLLAEFEPDVPEDDRPRAWLRFCNWVSQIVR